MTPEGGPTPALPPARGHTEPLCHLAKVQGASRCCCHCRPGLREWAGSAACVPGEGAGPDGPVFPDGAASHGAERPRRTGMNHGCREGPLSQHPMLASGRQGDVRPSPPPPLPCPPAQDCQVRCCRLCPVQGRPARSACQVVCLSRAFCSRTAPNVRRGTGAGGREPWKFTPGRCPAEVTLLGASSCPGTGPLPPGVRPVEAAGSAGPRKASLLP